MALDHIVRRRFGKLERLIYGVLAGASALRELGQPFYQIVFKIFYIRSVILQRFFIRRQGGF
jgi:hypothetical protein